MGSRSGRREERRVSYRQRQLAVVRIRVSDFTVQNEDVMKHVNGNNRGTNPKVDSTVYANHYKHE